MCAFTRGGKDPYKKLKIGQHKPKSFSYDDLKLPIIKVMALTISQDLISVKPMDGPS